MNSEMNGVWCIFYNNSDGCSYSFETLVAIYLSQSAAETGLLTLIETAQQLQREYEQFQQRIRECYSSKSAMQTLPVVLEERRKWREERFGKDDLLIDIPDVSIDMYDIRFVEMS